MALPSSALMIFRALVAGLASNVRKTAFHHLRCLGFASACLLTASTPFALPTAFAADVGPRLQIGKADGDTLKEIIIVYKSHFDIGYTAMARDVVNSYRTSMIDQTLRIIDQYKAQPKSEQFVWTIPGWPMEQMLWSGQDPARKTRIESAIRDGNLAVHALPFTTHTETAELEDLVRGLGHSSAIARSYGLPLPRGAKTTDAPGQPWMFPTVLHQAGIRFFHMGVNDATTPAKVPLLFWWEGPDGSRLLTMLTNTYGTSENPPRDWPYSAWIFIHMTSDNEGPPSPETVRKDVDTLTTRYAGAKVRVGQLGDFYDALEQGELAKVPVVRGDIPDVWIHGVASSPMGDHIVAQARPVLTAAEELATLSAAWGIPTAQPSKAVAAAYTQSLLWSEHTWGLASQNHVKFKYEKQGTITTAFAQPPQGLKDVEASWQEHIDYAGKVQQLLEKPCATLLQTLAAAVDIAGKRIVVFNPLPWTRDDLVSLPGTWAADIALQADDGESTAADTSGGVLRFLARGVPSLGYRTFRVVSQAPRPVSNCTADMAKHTIESPAYRLVCDPAQGKVVSLLDKRASRELLDTADARGLAYFYERFSLADAQAYAKGVLNESWAGPTGMHGDCHCRTGIPGDQPHLEFSPKHMTFAAQVTPLGVEAEMTGTLCAEVPQPVSLKFTLYRDLPCLDITVTADNQGRADAWPAACNFSLPFNIERPQFRVGRVGAIVNPVTDFLENTSRQSFWSNPGVAVFNERGGVGITAIDSPLVSLGEPGIMRFNGTYVPTKSRVYFNIQNNVWHTNFCDWWSGRMYSRFRLWTFDRYRNADALLMPGLNAKRPLLAALADGPAGKLPRTQTGLTVSRPGVLVTAFGANPDGAGTLLRVWEQIGEAGQLVVTLPGTFKTATPVNLRGEQAGEPVPVGAGKLTFNLPAYAPVSYVLN